MKCCENSKCSCSLSLSLNAVGPGRSQQQHHANPLMASEDHRKMYTSLRDCSRLLTRMNASVLSEKMGFAKHWKRLTRPFFLSDTKVARIEADEREDSERCYKVILLWVEEQGNAATVAKLAEAVWTHCQDATMLGITHNVLCNV